MIIVELKGTANYSLKPVPHNNPMVIQSTGLPGRTVQITRRPKKLVCAEFACRQRIASALESLLLLRVPPKLKRGKTDSDDDDDTANDAAVKKFAVGDEMTYFPPYLSTDHPGLPCRIHSVLDEDNYEIVLLEMYDDGTTRRQPTSGRVMEYGTGKDSLTTRRTTGERMTATLKQRMGARRTRLRKRDYPSCSLTSWASS